METRTVSKYVPRREDVVRIVVIDLPLQKIPGEGLYEWTYLADKQLMDLLTLEKELLPIVPDHPQLKPIQVVERVLDRLQNFRRLFINTVTGEISS